MLPQSAGRPPPLLKWRRGCQREACLLEATCGECAQTGGWHLGYPVLSSKGLASIQDPLETATPGPTETEMGGGRGVLETEISLAWLAGGG